MRPKKQIGGAVTLARLGSAHFQAIGRRGGQRSGSAEKAARMRERRRELLEKGRLREVQERGR
jgi:general stress protein YciG